MKEVPQIKPRLGQGRAGLRHKLKMPMSPPISTKTAIHKVETLTEKYIILDSLLFKLVTLPEKEAALLTIPEICTDKLITLSIILVCL